MQAEHHLLPRPGELCSEEQLPRSSTDADHVHRHHGGAIILDGRRVSKKWNKELKTEAARITGEVGRKPALCVILVGNRPDSVLYVTKKEEVCDEVNIQGAQPKQSLRRGPDLACFKCCERMNTASVLCLHLQNERHVQTLLLELEQSIARPTVISCQHPSIVKVWLSHHVNALP